jgi:hypothetical protein
MDVSRAVKVLGKMVECPEVSYFAIHWISKSSALTPPDLLWAQ